MYAIDTLALTCAYSMSMSMHYHIWLAFHCRWQHKHQSNSKHLNKHLITQSKVMLFVLYVTYTYSCKYKCVCEGETTVPVDIDATDTPVFVAKLLLINLRHSSHMRVYWRNMPNATTSMLFWTVGTYFGPLHTHVLIAPNVCSATVGNVVSVCALVSYGWSVCLLFVQCRIVTA